MAKEPWIDAPSAGQVLSSAYFFDELRANLTTVLSDYIGKGEENEATMQSRVGTLFRKGELLPSREDWTILFEALSLIAEEKEQTPMYNQLFSDVSDSLGAGDLLAIRNFLDYLQTIPPKSGGLSITLTPPIRQTVAGAAAADINNGPDDRTVRITWTETARQNGSAQAVITPSTSEDVLQYAVSYRAGSYTQELIKTPNNLTLSPLALEWESWDNLNAAPLLETTLSTEDKRGNKSSMTRKDYYPAGVLLTAPTQGYLVEVSRDGGPFTSISGAFSSNGNSKTFIWTPAPVNGTYVFRIQGKDTKGQRFGDGNSEWATTTPLNLYFLPEPPEMPIPKVETTWIAATVTWQACARADYYEVWMGDESWAKANEGTTHNYWQRVELNQNRSVTLHNLNQGATYTFYVRAVNTGGQTVGATNARIKVRVLKSKSYIPYDFKVWRSGYNYTDGYWNQYWYPADWKLDAKYLYQGEWREPDWGASWQLRGGGTYWAHENQLWGNNISFLFYDSQKMRAELGGKSIEKVIFGITRASGTAALNAHGYAEATPLYLYSSARPRNWNMPSSWDNSTYVADGHYSLYHADGRAVNIYNQEPIGSAIFNRGETEYFTGEKAKGLVKRILNGQSDGLGLVKFYGEHLSDSPNYSDKAYMLLSPTIIIEVQYYDYE